MVSQFGWAVTACVKTNVTVVLSGSIVIVSTVGAPGTVAVAVAVAVGTGLYELAVRYAG